MNSPAPPGPAPEPDDPARRLVTEVAQLRSRAAARDHALLRLGVALMVAGPVLAGVGYVQSSQTSSPFNQNDAIIVAIVGLAVTIVGVGLFLRYSLGELLRFWMARLVIEQQRPAVRVRREPVAPIRAPSNGRPSPPTPPARPAAADPSRQERP